MPPDDWLGTESADRRVGVRRGCGAASAVVVSVLVTRPLCTVTTSCGQGPAESSPARRPRDTLATELPARCLRAERVTRSGSDDPGSKVSGVATSDDGAAGTDPDMSGPARTGQTGTDLSRGGRRDKDNIWITLCRVTFYPLTAALSRRRFGGLEHLRAVPAGALIVANHVSHLDPIYNAVFVHKAGRWPHFMAKASIWGVPFVGRLMRGAQQIPVERGGGSGQQSLAPALSALAAGQMVLIYPEGTITRDPEKWPMKPKAGVAVLALAGDYPVIPVVNWGTHEVFVPYVKKGRFKPFPRKTVTVKAGPPVDLSEFRGKEPDARVIRDVSLRIMTAVRDLVAEVRDEVPPERFFVPRRVTESGEGSTPA